MAKLDSSGALIIVVAMFSWPCSVVVLLFVGIAFLLYTKHASIFVHVNYNRFS